MNYTSVPFVDTLPVVMASSAWRSNSKILHDSLANRVDNRLGSLLLPDVSPLLDDSVAHRWFHLLLSSAGALQPSMVDFSNRSRMPEAKCLTVDPVVVFELLAKSAFDPVLFDEYRVLLSSPSKALSAASNHRRLVAGSMVGSIDYGSLDAALDSVCGV